MKIKIGVMGSATGNFSKKIKEISYEVGCAIAKNDCITITGACPGLPLEAARGASKAGGLVVGISPGLSEWEHINRYHSPVEHHDVLVFTGSGLMGREVVNIRSSDIVIIVGGHSGTLGEFSIAFDEGKLIGILEGTGGITPAIRDIVKIVKKRTSAKIIYGKDPHELVRSLLIFYSKEHCKHPDIHHAYKLGKSVSLTNSKKDSEF